MKHIEMKSQKNDDEPRSQPTISMNLFFLRLQYFLQHAFSQVSVSSEI